MSRIRIAPRITRPRFALLAAAVLSVVSVAPVQAVQGVSLAWNHCLAQGTGVQNMQFACDTNSGQQQLVGAFKLSSGMSGVTGAEMVLQLSAAAPVLPAWWQFWYAGSCRQSALSVNSAADAGDVACPDWSQGQMFVGIGTYCTSTGSCVDKPAAANEVRLKLVEAVPAQAAMDLAAGGEYFSFNLVIQNAKTVGAGACAGCATPVCIVFNSINIVAGPTVNRFISTASAPGSNYVTWQGGGGTNCPAATPTRNATWGSVKSLYR